MLYGVSLVKEHYGDKNEGNEPGIFRPGDEETCTAGEPYLTPGVCSATIVLYAILKTVWQGEGVMVIIREVRK